MQSIKEEWKAGLDTPVMRQYLEVKSQHPDSIVFFRMGDFYEMFLEDAIEASQILDIALTKRQSAVPMAGIPFHSTDSYISRLLSAGKKVVICEQSKSSDPKAKIMNREVVRIISPGTVIEENLLSGFQNNFLGVIIFSERKVYLGLADISTSDLLYFSYDHSQLELCRANLFKFQPREILLLESQKEKWNQSFPLIQQSFQPLISTLPDWNPDSTTGPNDFEFRSIKELLDRYLNLNYRETQFLFKDPEIMPESQYLTFDQESVRNLEIIENEKNKAHTLFSVLNFCQTALGKRVLKKMLLFPSRDSAVIELRHKAILAFSSKKILAEIRTLLSETGDLERILSRFQGNKAFPRDFETIQKTISACKQIHKSLLALEGLPENLAQSFVNTEAETLSQQISDRLYPGELPIFLGNSPFLKEGFHPDLDESRKAKAHGKDWILQLEEKEKKETGLSSLKIRYNKILGYYIEISRVQAQTVKERYFKKQTLVTAERFTCQELEEIERKILAADELIDRIEKEEFDYLVAQTLTAEKSLRNLCQAIGNLDFILSLTQAKETYQWKKPEISKTKELMLRDSRHPVVEKFLNIGETFVPNSIHLDDHEESIAILTGPNMAGKSTFMRQIALNQILFQIGSFLPVKEAKLPIVDKIFTRIGSGDNLTAGESTFYLEMKETAFILNNMTEDSLILFDEVGRGTSTYDGLSLAWSILEHLAEREIRTKTIFATHYHELTELERGNGIFNLYMDTYEKEGEVLFLKKVKRGKVKKSFGIYVARLAGIPSKITRRAEEILEGLESRKKEIRIRTEEPSLFPGFQGGPDKTSLAMERIRKKLQTIQIEKTTPLESIQILEELQRWSKE
jgi:DNA mismatch repair protein MutS